MAQPHMLAARLGPACSTCPGVTIAGLQSALAWTSGTLAGLTLACWQLSDAWKWHISLPDALPVFERRLTPDKVIRMPFQNVHS